MAIISKLIQKLILTKNGFSKSKIPKSLNPIARGKVPIESRSAAGRRELHIIILQVQA